VGNGRWLHAGRRLALAEIELVNGRGVVLVDDEDYELVSQYSWRLTKPVSAPIGYALTGVPSTTTKSGRTTLLMHRLIVNAKRGQVVDHQNHDTLDNRKGNLRLGSYRLNNVNRAVRELNKLGYKGIRQTMGGKYRVRVGDSNNAESYVGTFVTLREAILAFNETSVMAYGEYAHLNPVPDLDDGLVMLGEQPVEA
jgi:hypothetical protein